MGSSERVMIVFITVVIYRSKHERFYSSKKILRLSAKERRDIVRPDPERKRKDRGKNERIRKEELILKIEAGTKNVSADNGN